MQAIRHGTMLPSLSQNKIGTSELDPFIAARVHRVDDEIIGWLKRREQRRRDRHVKSAVVIQTLIRHAASSRT